MNGYVIDASAVLAILRDEPGAKTASAHAQGALLSAVNLTEVLAKTDDRGGNIDLATSLINALGIVIEPFDREEAIVAAKLRKSTRYGDVSQADRACLALALVRGLPVPTGDRDWAVLDIGVATHLNR